MEKPCSRCKVVKPYGDFYRNSEKKDGYDSACKVCNVNRVRAWKRINNSAEKARRTRERYPLKAKANQRVNYLIRIGKMKKESCFLCGEKKADGHHLLYEFKEKVVWLCKIHHVAVHLQSRIESYEKPE